MLTNGMTLYEIEQVGEYGPWENIFMVINTTSEMLHFEVDEPGWSLYVNEQCAGTTAIKENVSKVYIAPYSIVLLAQSKSSE